MKKTILVWDGFVRSFHWLQFICLAGLWYTGENGLLNWHFLIGYILLGLLLTRIIWGFTGSDTAKFKHFIRMPISVVRYLKGNTKQEQNRIGHNPAGGYMVLALLTLILTQLMTGLFATDDVFTEGPLINLISYDLSLLLTKIHHINFNIILAFAAVHVLAVAIFQLKKHNLILPMITGFKTIDEDTVPNNHKMKSAFIAFAILLISFVGVYFLFAKDLLAYWL